VTYGPKTKNENTFTQQAQLVATPKLKMLLKTTLTLNQFLNAMNITKKKANYNVNVIV